MLDYSTDPRIRTHDGPCFKLADQSPKPLDHRNRPMILLPLNLLTASSLENRHFWRLILYHWRNKQASGRRHKVSTHQPTDNPNSRSMKIKKRKKRKREKESRITSPPITSFTLPPFFIRTRLRNMSPMGPNPSSPKPPTSSTSTSQARDDNVKNATNTTTHQPHGSVFFFHLASLLGGGRGGVAYLATPLMIAFKILAIPFTIAMRVFPIARKTDLIY